MPIISFVVSLIILSIIYRKMILDEKPAPIGKMQAIVPIVLGFISSFVSVAFFILMSAVFVKLGFNGEALSPAVRSLLAAFLQAGLPEEVGKLLMILLALWIFRNKVDNVYEYILIGAAVGFGFTLNEEFLYGSNGAFIAISRLFTVAAHMIFNIIMAKHLGLAKYYKKTGNGAVSIEYLKAILYPVLIHTVYDAFTADNRLMAMEGDEVMMFIGMGLAIVVIIILFIMQFVVIKNLKKDAEKYCAMNV